MANSFWHIHQHVPSKLGNSKSTLVALPPPVRTALSIGSTCIGYMSMETNISSSKIAYNNGMCQPSFKNTVCFRDLDKLWLWWFFLLKPISGINQAAWRLLLTLKVVKSDVRIIISSFTMTAAAALTTTTTTTTIVRPFLLFVAFLSIDIGPS